MFKFEEQIGIFREVHLHNYAYSPSQSANYPFQSRKGVVDGPVGIVAEDFLSEGSSEFKFQVEGMFQFDLSESAKQLVLDRVQSLVGLLSILHPSISIELLVYNDFPELPESIPFEN